MSSWWLEWVLAALGAALFWAIVIAIVATSLDRRWHRHEGRRPHSPHRPHLRLHLPHPHAR